jgi:hypothetical protein
MATTSPDTSVYLGSGITAQQMPQLTKNPDGTLTNASGVTFSNNGGAVIPTLPTQSKPIDVSALSGGTTPVTLPSAPTNPTQNLLSLLNSIQTNSPSAGMDATTYANFKAANPGLEPTAEDIARMQGGSGTPSINDLFGAAYAPTAADTEQTQTAGLLKSIYQKVTGLGGSVDSTGKIDNTGALAGAKDTAAQSLGYKNYADVQNQLQDINSQIQTLQKQTAAATTMSEDRLAPTFAISGEQAQIAHQATIKALGLSAIAQTLQGNVARAEDIASKAVEAEFLPYQTELNYLQNAYNLNKDQLTREDSKRAALLQAQLGERQRILTDAKADKTTAIGLASAAVKNYPGNQAAQLAAQKVLSLDATSPDFLQQVFSLVGQYQNDPQALQTAILDQQLKRAQINEANVSVEKTKAEINALNNPNQTLTAAGKPLTDAQSTALGYANRVQQASQVVDQLGAQFSDPKYYLGNLLPNFLQSSQQQQYQQAQTNFVNAVLRKESGAAISPSEFDSARKQYFPQPGDTPAVIAQKKANRDQVYQNLLQQAGNPRIPGTTSSSAIPAGTDGTAYGHPGYVSDGTQWVLKQ